MFYFHVISYGVKLHAPWIVHLELIVWPSSNINYNNDLGYIEEILYKTWVEDYWRCLNVNVYSKSWNG